MKKMNYWACLLMALALLPALAMAEGAGTAASAPVIDWTALVVAVIGTAAAFLGACLRQVWVKHVRPWLEQRDLSDAAKIVVGAVEALLGRYCGEEKWELALQKMAERGFNIDSDAVMDALRAAWKELDIQQIMARRYPLAELILCPVKVQGEGAAEQVVQAIELFNRKKAVDVLIVGRGGGSMEDLWAFNEEKVARAVAASSIPIISAVGHETDVTICDFVADCRAATPSAAAELAVPDQLELKDTLRSYQFTLTHLIRARMRNYHEQLHRLVASKSFQTPQTRVAMETMRLDRYTEQLSVAMKRKTEAEAHRLSKLSGQLHTLSPLQVLSRGYAIIQDKNQQTIKSTAQVCTGQQITVTLSDGVLDCTVDEVKCNE